MLHIINIEEKDGYLKVEISGKRSLRNEAVDAIEALSKVDEIRKAKNINNILLILRITGHFPFMASYDICKNAGNLGWSSGFKLAAVTMDEETMKSHLFTETVAVNRGYDVKMFDNELDATLWLLSS